MAALVDSNNNRDNFLAIVAKQCIVVQMQTGARINISDSTCLERIVTVRGTKQQVVCVFSMICRRVEQVRVVGHYGTNSWGTLKGELLWIGRGVCGSICPSVIRLCRSREGKNVKCPKLTGTFQEGFPCHL